MAEGRSKTEDRSKKAKNHMIQVDLIEVSSPQAEIFIQGSFFFGAPLVSTRYDKVDKIEKCLLRPKKELFDHFPGVKMGSF